MPRIYLDTAAVIYTVEQVSPYAEHVDVRLNAPDVELFASDLTRMECRVKPLRESDVDLLGDYDDFFGGSLTQVISLSGAIMDHATEIRAAYGFKTPDAIHLAAAVRSACDIFLTNDHRLDRFHQIAIEIIEPKGRG